MQKEPDEIHDFVRVHLSIWCNLWFLAVHFMIFSDTTGDQFPKTTVNGSGGANRTIILGYHSEEAEVVDTIDVYE
ncbi:hypothetical protein [Bacillus subtilis]|uniref:hypothetical protein n=1 Tax=Bacillus subtilis TaxID=1423 RepID=UPI001BDBA9BA|nr:hypothetical protein [Bacillus subtilis]